MEEKKEKEDLHLLFVPDVVQINLLAIPALYLGAGSMAAAIR